MKRVLLFAMAGAFLYAVSGWAEEAAKKPAAPACQKDVAAMHCLSIKDGVATCCACGAACKCTVSADNPAKCSCGKDVVKVNLTGKFVCGCGPDCKCNVIADKAGKCTCGKDLVEVKAKDTPAN